MEAKEQEQKDLSNLYEDDTQKSIENLKNKAEDLSKKYPVSGFTYRDIIMDVIFFFVTAGLSFAWMLLMLLIISFVTLSYIHFNIDKMILVSALFSVGVAIVYIIKKIKKYRG